MKKILLTMGAFLLIGMLVACNQDEDANEEEKEFVVPVETVEATEGELVLERSLYGRTAPASATPIMLPMAGKIDVLEVENGDEVAEDDLIAKLKTPAGLQNIKAAKKGEIIQLEAEEGDMVSETEPFAIIVDMETMKVNATVTSDVRSLLKKDAQLKMMIDQNEYEAEITSISKMPDDTGLYPIEASVENKEADILPGMTAVLIIPEKRIEKAIILPTEAIVEESDGAFVYVIKDDQAVKTEIEIKESQSEETAIEGEVNEGDQVVINGQLTLTDGSKVNVVKEGE